MEKASVRCGSDINRGQKKRLGGLGISPRNKTIGGMIVVSGMLAMTFLSPAAVQSKTTDYGGGLIMDDSRPPLAKHWIVGTTLSPPTLMELDNGDENLWKVVPAWSAGTWEPEGRASQFMRDERTKKEYHTDKSPLTPPTEVRGEQKDTAGTIWDFLEMSLKEIKDPIATSFKCFLYRDSQPGKDVLTTREDTVWISVDPKTQKILRVEQRQHVAVYKPLPKPSTSLAAKVGSRLYSADGELLKTEITEYSLRQAKPFENINKSPDGKNLFGMWTDFLTKAKKPELIPSIFRAK